MRKYIILILVISMGLFAITSCKRSEVNDPDMTGPAGFRIILSGTANPSTLYTTSNGSLVSSIIIVRALNNDGSPAVNKNVIFEQYVDSSIYGYFDNKDNVAVGITDGQGYVQKTFKIPYSNYIQGSSAITIKVTLSDSGRLDNDLSEIYDFIPLQLISGGGVAPEGDIRIYGRVVTNEGAAFQGVYINFTQGVTGPLITRASGSWDTLVPSGWSGYVIPTKSGYHFSPGSYFVENVNAPKSDINFTAIAD